MITSVWPYVAILALFAVTYPAAVGVHWLRARLRRPGRD